MSEMSAAGIMDAMTRPRLLVCLKSGITLVGDRLEQAKRKGYMTLTGNIKAYQNVQLLGLGDDLETANVALDGVEYIKAL